MREHIPTHERLLTREQIDALDDLESLTALQDDVSAAAKAIEVDLEYRSDEDADEYWEQRARTALTAHYVCNGHLTRRINYLRRGGKPVKQGGEDAKARRKEAEAARLAQVAENKRLKAAEDREKTVRAMVAYADRQSLLAAFHRAAKKTLDHLTFQRLMAAARAEMEASMHAELPAQGIEARSDETPAAAQPEGQEPGPKGAPNLPGGD